MANLPSAFIDDNAVSSLDTRVPAAVTLTGMYYTGSNAPGIGIATDNAGLEQSLPNWTLLDQHGNARDAQISQLIGGNGICGRTGNVSTTWDKTQVLYSESGAASSGGWTSPPTTGVGTSPDATVRLYVNPANVEGAPDNNASPTADNSAVLLDLAVGWTSAIPTP